MKNRIKKSMALLLAVIMLLCAVPFTNANITADAITFSQLNDSSVFLKQAGSTTCTLCATTMMLRRYSMLRGDSKWNTITESSVRSPGWINGTGLRWSFSYSNSYVSSISVGHGTLPGGSSNSSTLIEMLKKCPEGIVIYNTSVPHAVLLTDYTDGVFYCGDPLGSYPSGRIPLTSAYKVRINNVTAYWKVTSPVVSGPTNAHTHSYAEHYESAHPHKKYMKCSCGDWYYTGATTYVDSCSDCWNLNRVDVWVSNIDKTAEISEGIVQNQYQFWFKLANKDTGALYNSYGSTRGYKSKISVYNPDGSELFSYTYDDSDYNWIRAVPKQLGNYKVRIELSGNITADYYEYFTVKSDIKIHFEDTSRLTVVEGQSKTFKAWADGNWPDGTTVDWSINNEIATAELKSGTVTITGVKQGLALYVLSAYYPDKNVIASESRWIKVVPSTYTITYNANGGSGAPSSQKKEYGKTLTLSSTKPTRSGYTFLGWSTSSSATSATYKAGATYSANSNATLYAVWSKNTYTLSFNASGGTGAPQNMIGNTTYTIPSTVPKRFGWNFQGWRYLNDSGSYTYYKPGDKITINKNTTLTASWGGTSFSYPGVEAYSQINYPGEIHYIEYTSITTGKYVIYSYGEDDTYGYLYDSQGNILASNDDGGDGRNFRIEYNFIEGKTYYFGIKYYSSSKVGAIHSNFGRVYTINYNANGGSGAPASQSKDWNKNISLSTAIPTRKGYTFLGWSICGSISNPEVSVTFKAGATYSTNGNMTLYAVWKSNPCSHTYNSGKITTAATCKSTGVKTYTCTVCKATKTESIAKNPSNHVGGTSVKNAKTATCTAKGYTGDTYCLGCGVVTAKGRDIAIKAHTYDSGKITTAATCKSTGVKTYTCTVCKATKTESIAKNPSNHADGTSVKNAKTATCTAKGYTGDTYCLGCGVVTVKGTEIPALGHTDSNSDGKCDRCGITLGEPEKPNTPDTPTANCTHLCHKGGFIWRIVRFFWKLFKINRNCSCGVAHY